MIKIIKIAIPFILVAASFSMYIFYTRFVEVKVDISNLADKELEMKREMQVQASTVQTLSEALLIQKEKVAALKIENKLALDSLERTMHWQKIRIIRQYEDRIDSLNNLIVVKPGGFLPGRYPNKGVSSGTAVDRNGN